MARLVGGDYVGTGGVGIDRVYSWGKIALGGCEHGGCEEQEVAHQGGGYVGKTTFQVGDYVAEKTMLTLAFQGDGYVE